MNDLIVSNASGQTLSTYEDVVAVYEAVNSGIGVRLNNGDCLILPDGYFYYLKKKKKQKTNK